MAEDNKNPSALTIEQRAKLNEWLRAKWKAGGCPVCQANNWGFGDHLVSPPLFARGGMMLGGPQYPQAMIICGNCGYTIYFNATLTGLLPADAPKTDGTNG